MSAVSWRYPARAEPARARAWLVAPPGTFLRLYGTALLFAPDGSIYAESLTETAAGSDTATPAAATSQARSETAAGADTASTTASAAAAGTEATAGADAAAGGSIYAESLSETASGADMADATVSAAAAAAEAATGADGAAPPILPPPQHRVMTTSSPATRITAVSASRRLVPPPRQLS